MSCAERQSEVRSAAWCGVKRAQICVENSMQCCVCPSRGRGGQVEPTMYSKAITTTTTHTHTQTDICHRLMSDKSCKVLSFVCVFFCFVCFRFDWLELCLHASCVIVVYRLSIAGNNNYCNAMEIVLLSNRHTHTLTHTIAWHYVALFVFCFDEFWQQQQLLQPQQ